MVRSNSRCSSFSLRAQLPLQMRVDDGERLVEEDGGHVRPAPARGRARLSASRRRSARAPACSSIGDEVEHLRRPRRRASRPRRAGRRGCAAGRRGSPPPSWCRRSPGTGKPARCCAPPSAARSRPCRRRRTRPSLGVISPEMMLRSVVLPQPEGPSSA